MIRVDRSLCNGCGICADACPTGAISVEGRCAVVAAALCRDCAACVSACPVGALGSVAAPVVVIESAPAAVRQRQRAATPSWRQAIVPAALSLAGFAWREVVPLLLDGLATAGARGTQSGSTARPRSGGPQRFRHRGGRNQ